MHLRQLQAVSHGLVLVAAMLALIALALWLKPGPLEATAMAGTPAARAGAEGVPDTGRQFQAMIEQLESLNRRLGDIEKGLRDGSYVVQVNDAKAKTGGKESNP